MNRARLFDDHQNGNALPDLREVLAAQLNSALNDGEEHIAKSLEALIALLMGFDELENRYPDDRELIASLKASAGELVQQLQFFDAHSQRVTHVADAIVNSACSLPLSAQQNSRCLEELRAHYTCEAEHETHRSLTQCLNGNVSQSQLEDD